MFKAEFSTGNAAFDDAPASEAGRILREIARKIEQGESLGGGPIHDTNGNRIGQWTFEPSEPEEEEQEEEPAALWLNQYKCPECGNEWDDEWPCQVDDDCAACGERAISPHTSEEVEG